MDIYPSDIRSGRSGPRLCENSRGHFLCVYFSHVDAVSLDSSASINLLALLRGGRNEFSHSLGRLLTGLLCTAGFDRNLSDINDRSRVAEITTPAPQGLGFCANPTNCDTTTAV